MIEKNEPNNELKQAETTAMDNLSHSSTTPQDTPLSSAPHTPPRKNPLPYAALGVSIVALVTSGWLYYQNSQTNYPQQIQQLNINHAKVTDTLQQLKTPEQQLQALQLTLAKQQQELTQQATHFTSKSSEQEQKISQLQARVNRLSNTTKEDWKLAEAEYLVRLASQRLLLESDSLGSEALLSNADDILKSLEDPIVFDARKAIAADIQALKAINHFDLEGQYLKLNALYHSVDTLPQREPSKAWQAAQLQDNTTSDAIENTFTNTVSELWQSLKSLVVINYQSKPIEALLPPAQYQQLITGLQLQLDVAQVSMVKGENSIYQNALERVAKAVTEHFDTESNSVTSFLASLTELQQINPEPELPSPRNSLIEMKKLANAWKDRSSEDLTQEPSSLTAPAITPDTSETLAVPENDEITGSDLLEEQTKTKIPAEEDTAPVNDATKTAPEPSVAAPTTGEEA